MQYCCFWFLSCHSLYFVLCAFSYPHALQCHPNFPQGLLQDKLQSWPWNDAMGQFFFVTSALRPQLATSALNKLGIAVVTLHSVCAQVSRRSCHQTGESAVHSAGRNVETGLDASSTFAVQSCTVSNIHLFTRGMHHSPAWFQESMCVQEGVSSVSPVIKNDVAHPDATLILE